MIDYAQMEHNSLEKDIVEKLEEGAYDDALDDALMKQAAAEIRRLRAAAEIRRLRAMIDNEKEKGSCSV